MGEEVQKLEKEIRSLRKQVERLEKSRATFEIMCDRNANLLGKLAEQAEREKNRLARDLEIARDIQRNLLPKTTPEIPGYQIGDGARLRTKPEATTSIGSSFRTDGLS